jgi:hypothetical protein
MQWRSPACFCSAMRGISRIWRESSIRLPNLEPCASGSCRAGPRHVRVRGGAADPYADGTNDRRGRDARDAGSRRTPLGSSTPTPAAVSGEQAQLHRYHASHNGFAAMQRKPRSGRSCLVAMRHGVRRDGQTGRSCPPRAPAQRLPPSGSRFSPIPAGAQYLSDRTPARHRRELCAFRE